MRARILGLFWTLVAALLMVAPALAGIDTSPRVP